MNILLAFDGSESSLNAVRALIQRVSWFRDPLHIHVAYVQPSVPNGLVRTFISQEVLDDYYRDEGEKAIAPACTVLEQAKVPYTKHLHVGPVAQSIVQLANEHECELIWMGTRGHGAAASLMLGSTATKVLQLPSVPVLLIG